MLRRITLAALVAATALAGLALAPAGAEAGYLHVFNACGIEPGGYASVSYNPPLAPPAPNSLLSTRAQAISDMGGSAKYTHGRTVNYYRQNANTVLCHTRHWDKPDFGFYVDFHTTVSGDDSYRMVGIRLIQRGWSATG